MLFKELITYYLLTFTVDRYEDENAGYWEIAWVNFFQDEENALTGWLGPPAWLTADGNDVEVLESICKAIGPPPHPKNFGWTDDKYIIN